MKRINLDMDALRTLVAAHQLGSFSRAADQIGRSQSAVSQQIHKLEEQAGETLFRKQGRGLALTDAGEIMLGYARRILDLNDETVSAVARHTIEGTIRFGVPADFAGSWLPTALERFRHAHPSIRIEATVDRNRQLIECLDKGELDLVLALNNEARSDAERVASLPFVWIGSRATEPRWANGEPIPLALFQPPCFFRKKALRALDEAGLAWRISFASPNLNGLWAAVEAGLGITLRIATGLPAGVRVMSDRADLPSVSQSSVALCLHDGGRPLAPTLSQLRSIIAETIQQGMTNVLVPERLAGPSLGFAQS